MNRKNLEQDRAKIASDVATYLARGGEIKKIRDCSPKESYFRSFKLYKDLENPNKTYRKKYVKADPVDRPPVVFSGYNSGKK